MRIIDPDPVGRAAAQPFADAKALQTFGDELHFAAGHNRMMDPDDGADAIKILDTGVLGMTGFDQGKASQPVMSLGSSELGQLEKVA